MPPRSDVDPQDALCRPTAGVAGLASHADLVQAREASGVPAWLQCGVLFVGQAYTALEDRPIDANMLETMAAAVGIVFNTCEENEPLQNSLSCLPPNNGRTTVGRLRQLAVRLASSSYQLLSSLPRGIDGAIRLWSHGQRPRRLTQETAA